MRYIEAAFQVKTLWHCRIRNYETAEDILYGVKLSVYRHLADHHGFTTRTIKTFHSCKQLEVEGGTIKDTQEKEDEKLEIKLGQLSDLISDHETNDNVQGCEGDSTDLCVPMAC